MKTKPIVKALAVTPNDSTVFERACRGLYIGGTGDLRVLHAEDSVPVTYVGVPSGYYFPVEVIKVLATGTTATNIIAGF